MEHNAKEKNLERIALKMTSSLDLQEVLSSITQGLVDELDAALARIWLIGPGDLCSECHKVDSCTNRQSCLHLTVSAGIHTGTNGEFRRVPLGALKIGSIAQGTGSISTNDVINDERVYNKEWLIKNKLRSFAGHPLIFRGETLGVLGMFSRRVMEQEEFTRIALFAHQASVAIKNAQLFETLKKSEAERKAIIESTPNPLVITSKSEGRILYANPQFGAAFGLSADELLGRRVPDLYYDPSDRKKLLDKISQTGSVHNYEILLKKVDGTPIWVSACVQPLVFRENLALITVLTNITDRKQTEEALEQLRQKNDLILQSAGEGIYGLDQYGNTTFVNPAAAQILGWSPEDLLGKPQHALIHHTKPDGAVYDREDCPIYAAFKDGHIHTVTDELFWRKDGTSLPVEYTSTPIRDENGQLTGAVVTFRDITQRKQAEKALRDALDEVEELKDQLQAENTYLQEEIRLEHNFDNIISTSASFKQVLRNVEQVASTDTTVLILGETGTGKELIARALHTLSPRKERPLVKVNCAALPASLIESELFGHEKGAFTGAVTRKQGRFELADRGTIFLDEIGDLPLDLQAKLLRALQEGEFERVGGTQTIKVDVRVIAATNRNLEEASRSGEFREDLFYRLNVFPIVLPPLRERSEDIPVLMNHFIKKLSAKTGKKITTIPQKVMTTLQAYDFPGNVRELENIIERAIILSNGQTLQLDQSLEVLKSPAATERDSTLEEVERQHILATLEKTNWRIEGPKGAALPLGINPNTLRSRMQRFGIKKPSQA